MMVYVILGGLVLIYFIARSDGLTIFWLEQRVGKGTIDSHITRWDSFLQQLGWKRGSGYLWTLHDPKLSDQHTVNDTSWTMSLRLTPLGNNWELDLLKIGEKTTSSEKSVAIMNPTPKPGDGIPYIPHNEAIDAWDLEMIRSYNQFVQTVHVPDHSWLGRVYCDRGHDFMQVSNMMLFRCNRCGLLRHTAK